MSRSASGSTRMLFQSGSRMTSNDMPEGAASRWRGLALGARALNRFRDVSELLEVLAEHLGQLVRLRVVRRRIRPGAARVEHAGRDVTHRLWHAEPEHRILAHRSAIERTVEDGVNHGARVRELHPLADAVRTSAPARVHQPHAAVVLVDQAT